MSDGAILDLVSRGKKDAFFIQNPRQSWFGTHYVKRSPSAKAIRNEFPATPARFGHWIDIDLPRSVDVLTHADIRIQMPTWLPGNIATRNRIDTVEVQAPDGVSWRQYGWTNGIANFLISRWALFMDNIMLQEGYGDYNDWEPDSRTTHLHAPIIHAATGTHDGSDLNIQRNATPPELVFRVPLVGCQGPGDAGFPTCAVKAQRLYLRLWLRDLTELVESANIGTVDTEDYEGCPQPWDSRAIRVTGSDGIPVIVPEVTLADYEIGHPVIYAQYACLYLDPEARASLAEADHAILYRQQLREDFTIEESAWAAALASGSSQIKHRLEVHGLFQRLMLGFLSIDRQKQNKWRDIDPPGGGEWLTEVEVNVNGLDRIQPLEPKKVKVLSQNTQLKRDVERALYFLIFGVSPDEEPAGACNLARTQKVQLILNLAAVSQANLQTYATVMGEAWNIMDIKDGIVSVRFTD